MKDAHAVQVTFLSRCRGLTPLIALALGVVGPLAASTPAAAAGYAFREYSALSLGRAHATIARLETPEVLFANPAGMLDLEGLHASLGASLVAGTITWADPDGGRDDVSMSVLNILPSAAVTWKVHPRWAVGLGFAAPYGLSLDWPENFPGQSIVSRVQLEIPNAYAGVGFEIVDGLRIGVAGQWAPARAELKRVIDVQLDSAPESIVDLEGTGHGFGASVGLQYRPSDRWFLGFAYKSRMKVKIEGHADFRDPNNPDNDTRLDATVEAWTPDHYVLGAGVALGDRWFTELDVTLQDWRMVEDLTIEFEGRPDEVSPQDWGLSWIVGAGADWRALDWLLVQFGAAIDLTPVPDSTLSPLLPDSDRYFLTGGLSFQPVDMPWAIDLAGMVVLFRPRSVDNDIFDGDYDTLAGWASLSVRYVGGPTR